MGARAVLMVKYFVVGADAVLMVMTLYGAPCVQSTSRLLHCLQCAVAVACMQLLLACVHAVVCYCQFALVSDLSTKLLCGRASSRVTHLPRPSVRPSVCGSRAARSL